MRLALFDDYRLGVVESETIRDVSSVVPNRDAEWPWAFVPRFIAHFDELRPEVERAVARAEARPLSSVRLLSPLPWPGQIVAAAANYHEHHREMAARPHRAGQQTAQGEFFLKAPASVIGHGGEVAMPRVAADREVHHEAELAAVVGRRMRNVPVEKALDYVFGYTCLLDMTLRGFGDRSRRKSYTGFTPIGPWIVTADEIPDPQDLQLRLWRNGDLRQDTNTRDMVYSTAEMLAYASAVMTLYPGDVLTTGTPAGVGPVEAGDVVEMEVERIGRLRVTMLPIDPAQPVAEIGLGSPRT